LPSHTQFPSQTYAPEYKQIIFSFSLDQATGSAMASFIKPYGNVTIIDEHSDPGSEFLTIFGTVHSQYLSSNVISVHIHGPASLHTDGPVMFTICGLPSDIPCNPTTPSTFDFLFHWSQDLPSSGIMLNKTLAQSGMYYLNINTLANSGGELRGHVTPSCNGACFSPILPSAKQFQPKLRTNSSASCSFISCFFPYEYVQEVFQSITMQFFYESCSQRKRKFRY